MAKTRVGWRGCERKCGAERRTPYRSRLGSWDEDENGVRPYRGKNAGRMPALLVGLCEIEARRRGRAGQAPPLQRRGVDYIVRACG